MWHRVCRNACDIYISFLRHSCGRSTLVGVVITTITIEDIVICISSSYVLLPNSINSVIYTTCIISHWNFIRNSWQKVYISCTKVRHTIRIWTSTPTNECVTVTNYSWCRNIIICHTRGCWYFNNRIGAISCMTTISIKTINWCFSSTSNIDI